MSKTALTTLISYLLEAARQDADHRRAQRCRRALRRLGAVA